VFVSLLPEPVKLASQLGDELLELPGFGARGFEFPRVPVAAEAKLALGLEGCAPYLFQLDLFRFDEAPARQFGLELRDSLFMAFVVGDFGHDITGALDSSQNAFFHNQMHLRAPVFAVRFPAERTAEISMPGRSVCKATLDGWRDEEGKDEVLMQADRRRISCGINAQIYSRPNAWL
jgi:hypothetical protein